jgi:hypothetical protein
MRSAGGTNLGALRGRRLHEVDDGLLGGAVVPRGQRVGLGLYVGTEDKQRAQGKYSKRDCALRRGIHVFHR